MFNFRAEKRSANYVQKSRPEVGSKQPEADKVLDHDIPTCDPKKLDYQVEKKNKDKKCLFWEWNALKLIMLIFISFHVFSAGCLVIRLSL